MLKHSDFSDRYQTHFTLGTEISTRDRDGIRKTFSGLMKIIHPSGEAAPDEIEELLRFAIEGRKRVKDQILRIDPTMAGVTFGYTDAADESAADPSKSWHSVQTLEEQEYGGYYSTARGEEEPQQAEAEAGAAAPSMDHNSSNVDHAEAFGIHFDVKWDETIHDRSIRADNGWTILLGRGLDIYQKGSGSQFDLSARNQQFRHVHAFGVTYIHRTHKG